MARARRRIPLPTSLPRWDQKLDRFIEESLQQVVIPEYVPPTPEELARRRKLFEETARIREAIGPIGVSVTDLIREDRDLALYLLGT